MMRSFSLLSCSILFLFLFLFSHQAEGKYMMGATGESCFQTCHKAQMNCNPHIETNNSAAIFQQLGIKCTANPAPWWAEDQPSYVAVQSDKNFGECLGYNNVPTGVGCGGQFESVQRLCNCDPPTTSKATFGNGVSAGGVGPTEQWIFQHFVAPGDFGVMTHFWFTLPNPGGDGLLVKYYVDGETTASIQFYPALAAGVGFNDNSAPWGTKWIGKGAKDGSYFINIRVPFQKSIVVSAQHAGGLIGGFYMIVRGATNLPISWGNVPIPNTAKLNLAVLSQNFKPLDLITLAEAKSGAGAVLLHTLVVTSGNMNFMEGCYHWYTPDNMQFPGVVLSTGMEDYFDSGWYFNAGGFHLPTAGLTHLDQTNGVHLSAYRFHEQDPLLYKNGFTFQWRNGDVVDAAGIKCLTLTGGTVGSPTTSTVTSYVWYYSW